MVHGALRVEETFVVRTVSFAPPPGPADCEIRGWRAVRTLSAQSGRAARPVDSSSASHNSCGEFGLLLNFRALGRARSVSAFGQRGRPRSFPTTTLELILPHISPTATTLRGIGIPLPAFLILPKLPIDTTRKTIARVCGVCRSYGGWVRMEGWRSEGMRRSGSAGRRAGHASARSPEDS